MGFSPCDGFRAMRERGFAAMGVYCPPAPIHLSPLLPTVSVTTSDLCRPPCPQAFAPTEPTCARWMHPAFPLPSMFLHSSHSFLDISGQKRAQRPLLPPPLY